MIDIFRYLRLKETTRLYSEDGFICVEFRRYDHETGAEIKPEIQKVTPEELAAKLSTLDREAKAIRLLLGEDAI